MSLHGQCGDHRDHGYHGPTNGPGAGWGSGLCPGLLLGARAAFRVTASRVRAFRVTAFRVATLVVAVLLATALQGCAVAQPGRVSVFVSILPQKYFVERIGGDHVDVSVMVQPGQSPETYQPTPKQMSALSQSSAYFAIGVPFEKVWLDKIKSANRAMQVVDTSAGIALRPIESHHHEGEPPLPDSEEAAEGLMDPHIWLDPVLVKEQCASIVDALSSLDPANASDYARGYESFSRDLDALDAEIRGILSGVTFRKFMVFHPSYGYFADRYGLTQIPIEVEGKEPGSRELAAVIDEAKAEGIRVVFVQSEFSTKAARAIASAIGARVETIDPLAEDYINNLRHIAESIASQSR